MDNHKYILIICKNSRIARSFHDGLRNIDSEINFNSRTKPVVHIWDNKFCRSYKGDVILLDDWQDMSQVDDILLKLQIGDFVDKTKDYMKLITFGNG